MATVESIHGSLARFLAALLFIAVTSSAVLFAQSNFGSIRGQVTDATGGAIPNARVVIRDIGTNAHMELMTSAEGFYSAASMRPVVYEITIEVAGFQKLTLENVKVDTAKTTTADAILKPGLISDTVTVTGAAPLLQTYTGAVTQNVNQRTIVDTPLNGRNTLELALTLPGVSGNVGSEIGSYYNTPPIPGREIIVNGGRPGTTQFIADGQNVTGVALGRTAISFSPDTVQEFSILQSNYSAQYSQAGGGIIQQTTKSGTNEIHGTAYWFHRQREFTATPFVTQRLPQFGYEARPPLRRQQLGIVGGGPVVLPKIYNGKNRTFWFATYEPLRQVQGNMGPSFERVPTDLEIQGDFSQSYTYDSAGTQRAYPQLYNHFSRDSSGTLHYLSNPNFNSALPVDNTNPLYQYAGFQMFNPNDPDPNRRGRVLVDAAGRSYVNPASAKIARLLYPRPNLPMFTSGPNAGANYVYFQQTTNTDDRWSTRLDHRIGDNHNLSFKYAYQPLYADRYFRDPVTNPGTSDTSLSRSVILNATSSLRPNLVNEFRAGYVYGNFARNFPSNYLNTDGTTPLLDLGGPGRGDPNFLGYGLADFFNNGGPANNQVAYGRLGFNGVQNIGRNTEHSYSLSDDLSWIRGSQTLKFGFLGGLQMSNAAAPGYGYQAGGKWTFRGTNTTADAIGCSAPNAPGINGPLPSDCRNATARTGDPFAAFLVGVTDVALAYENIAQPYYYRWMQAGGYAQDDWKVKSNLTLNLGLRYQFQSPRWEKYNRQGQLNLDRMEANPFNLDASGKPLMSPVFEFAGYGGRSRYLTPAQYKDLEPRLGFAWLPDFDFNNSHKLVVRGGYGITHSILTGRNRVPFPNLGSKLDAHRAYNVVFGTTELNNPSNVGGCGYAICQSDIPGQFGYNNVVYQPDPTLFVIPSDGAIHPGTVVRTVNGVPQQDKRYAQTGFVFDQNSKTPMIQNYSFELQYEAMRDTVVTAGIRGAHGTHLFSTPREINNNPFNAQRVYPGFNGASGGRIILMDETAASSQYWAGVFEIERRYSSGLQFRVNYTWSKSIDDSSGGIEPDFGNLAGQDSGAQTIRGNAPQNSFGKTNERAVSNFDFAHVFNFTGFYELPFGRGRKFLNGNRWMDLLTGGYQITGLARIQQGQPTYADLGDSNQLGFASNSFSSTPRPDVAAGVPLQNPDWTAANALTTPYMNPRVFRIPDPGTFGDASRNFSQLRMPWVRTFDASVFKSFHPWENKRRYVQVRVEAFNVLNARQLGWGGARTSLFNGLAQNLPGQPNRYANLNSKVWDAIIKRDPTGLQGDPTAALPPQGQVLSEGGVYADLVNRYNRQFYVFDSSSYNTIAPRVLQFALKFYF